MNPVAGERGLQQEGWRRLLPARRGGTVGLLSEAQFPDYQLITLEIVLLEIIEETPSRVHHLDQSVTGTVILPVIFQMFCEQIYPLRQKSHLHLGGSSVLLMTSEFFLDFFLWYPTHICNPFLRLVSFRFPFFFFFGVALYTPSGLV